MRRDTSHIDGNKPIIQVNDETLKLMCQPCEYYCGDCHDYSDCNKCIAYKVFCEFERYHYWKSWERPTYVPHEMGCW